MYNIFFYKDKKGNEPVKEYIISLKKKKPNAIAATGSQEHRMDAFPASI